MKNGKLEGKDIENIYWLIAEKYKTERKGIFLYKNAFLLGNLMMRLNNGTPIGRSANGLIKKIKANNFVFVPACKEDDH